MMLQSCTGLLGRREPVRMRLTGMKRVPPSPFADLMRIGSRSRARKSFTLLVRAVKERQNDHHPPPTPTQHALHVGRDGTIILRRCADMHAAASASHRPSRAVLCALDACSPRAHPQERPQTDGPITPTANPNHAQRARCNARLTYGGRGGGQAGFARAPHVLLRRDVCFGQRRARPQPTSPSSSSKSRRFHSLQLPRPVPPPPLRQALLVQSA